MIETGVRFKVDPGPAKAGGQQVENALRGISHQAKSAFDSMAGRAQALGRELFSLRSLVMGLGVGLVAKQFLEVSTQTENLGVRLRFLLGDANAAGKALKSMTEYASTTPFEFEDIQQAGTLLASVTTDIDELRKMLEITGDISAVTGLDFKTTAEQLQRSFSAGINAADLFRERGVNAMLGFEAGVNNSAETTKRKIMEMWDDPTFRLRGAAGELAKTWDGMVSMMADKWFLFRQKVMDSGPFEFLKAAVTVINKELDTEFGTLEDAAERLGKKIVETFKASMIFGAQVVDTLTPIGRAFGSLVKDFVDVFNGLPDWAKEVGVIGMVLFGKKVTIVAGAFLAITKQVADALESVMPLGDITLPSDAIPGINLQGSLFGVDDPDGETMEARVRRILDMVEKVEAANRAAASAEPATAGAAPQPRQRTALEKSMGELELKVEQQSRLTMAMRDGAAATFAMEARIEAENLLRKDSIELTEENIAKAESYIRSLNHMESEQAKLNASMEEAKNLATEMQTPFETYQERLKQLKVWLDADSISQETFNRAVKKAKEEFEQADEEMKRLGKGMEDLGLTFTSAFEDAIVGGKSFSDILVGLEQDIIRLAVRMMVTEPLMGMFKPMFADMGSSIGSFLFGADKGAAFGTSSIIPMDKGGILNRPTMFPMRSGDMAMGGEIEDEAIMPLGRMSNGDLGIKAEGLGGGATVNIQIINQSGEPVRTTERQNSGGGRDIMVMIGEGIANDIRKGGPVNRAIKETFPVGTKTIGR